MIHYKKHLQEIAQKLDKIEKKDDFYLTRVNAILEDYSDKAIFEFIQQLSVVAQVQRLKASPLLSELSKSLLQYAGYYHLKQYTQLSSKETHQTLRELKEELNNLIGLNVVKDEINNLISYQQIQLQRKEKGLKIPNRTLHMAFIGNPGTGKTTVARIVGRMYKDLGLLSKGHFLEVSRTDLIAGYQGQTALKVKQVIEKAKGGVLFIDEAYSITENENTDSYGRECLTELTKALEDFRDDLVVIVSGYREPMERFFQSNPGVKSRFNYFIDFQDYSSEELVQIFEIFCEQDDYLLESNLKIRLQKYFEDSLNNIDKNFSNGRFVRNIYERILMKQSVRLSKTKNTSKEDLQLLTIEDF